jgi:hypothetical protein
MKSTTVLQFRLNLSDIMWHLATEGRQEAARLWNRMVKLQLWFRRKQKSWPTQSDFEKHFKGKQALCLCGFFKLKESSHYGCSQ